MDPNKFSPGIRRLARILLPLTGIILFVALGVSLETVWIRQFDRQLINLARSQPALSFFRAVTILGSDYVLTTAILLTVFVLYRTARTAELITTIGVGVSAKVLEQGFKLLFHRARPDAAGLTDNTFGGYSFPSGHGLNSAAIYGFILVLIGMNVKRSSLKYLVLIGGVAIIVTIGVSRVILLAHWPSDVVGGWIIASTLLLISMLVLPNQKASR